MMLANEIIERARARAKPSQRPKLIAIDGAIVADAVVIVSPDDVNWWRGKAFRTDGEIKVRRPRCP